MTNLFENPIKIKKIRNDLYAYQYKNGTIIINGRKYVFYSMTDSIKKYRKDFPK